MHTDLVRLTLPSPRSTPPCPASRGLFTTRTAEELLWGYRDPLLASLAPLLPGINPTFQLLQNMSGPAEADCYPATLVNTGTPAKVICRSGGSDAACGRPPCQ